MDDNGVDGMMGSLHSRQGMEEGRIAVDGLKVRHVVFLHAYSIEGRFAVEVGQLEVEYIFWSLVAHGEHEAVLVDVPVEEHGVRSHGRACRGDGERVLECRDLPFEHVLGLHFIAQWAIDAGASRHQYGQHE